MLIDDGKNGFIFEPGNEAELAKHLVTLGSSQELRRKMGELLYEKASRDFSIDRMVEHQLEIYESILSAAQQAEERSRLACGWNNRLRRMAMGTPETTQS